MIDIFALEKVYLMWLAWEIIDSAYADYFVYFEVIFMRVFIYLYKCKNSKNVEIVIRNTEYIEGRKKTFSIKIKK